MTEIFTARSVEEAKDLAAKKFGKKISEISFEIIDEGKKGIFGLGAKEAKVKATVETASAAQTTAPKAEAKPVTTAPAPKAAEPVTKAPAAEKPVVTTETKAAPQPAEKKAEEAPTESNAAEDMEEEAYSLDNFTLIEDEAQ